MYCKKHNERSGINTCSRCGEWLCSECSIEVDGRVFCKNCIADAMHVGGYKKVEGGSPAKRHSWGLLFIFSFMFPGINYMFLGLIKRGLFALSSAILLLYLGITFSAPVFFLVFAGFWVTNIFDGFQIRRRLNAGEPVVDDVEDVKNFFRKNKASVLIFTVLIVVIGVFSWFEDILWRIGMTYPVRSLLSGVIPLIVVGFLVYLFTGMNKKPKSAPKKSDDIYSGDSN